MKMRELKFSLRIPNVENVHTVLHAFLRTCKDGEWLQEESEKTDPFVLCYRRGSWKKSFLGLGKRLVPDQEFTRPQDAPMRLTVSLRPSPEEVDVGLRYQSHMVESIFRKKMDRSIEEVVRSEVSDLASYLRKFYELPALPDLRAG